MSIVYGKLHIEVKQCSRLNESNRSCLVLSRDFDSTLNLGVWGGWGKSI